MSIPAIILIATLIAYFASLWKLFQKAGQDSWKGFIPGYNFFIWQKITNRPWYWILILIIPGVQFLMLIIMNVQLSWSFGQRGFKNTLLAVVAPFYHIPKMAFSDDVQYTGNVDWKKEKKSGSREWGDALLFAIIVAFIVRTFIFEAFTIPTGSMERSMLIGDYLFVSKARYGAKLPETPISFPLTHHTLPVFNAPSFLEWQKLDYFRLPGWSEVAVGDPVVFNFPEGDTVLVGDEAYSYYQFLRNEGLVRAKNNKELYSSNPAKYEDLVRKAVIKGNYRYQSPSDGKLHAAELTIRPKDKKENYVKRCVAGPGDILEIKDRQIYLNDKIQDQFEHLQQSYRVYTNTALTNKHRIDLKSELDLSYSNVNPYYNNPYLITLTNYQIEPLKGMTYVDSILPMIDPPSTEFGTMRVRSVFPHSPDYDWSRDNFGPLTMPAKGMKMELNLQNINIYRRAIETYEENEVYVKDGQIFINGNPASSYTFKMDYYWLMGDNRHNSLDSRYWGFVPEDHVVGRPSFTWLSLDQELGWTEGKLRWSRMFKGVD